MCACACASASTSVFIPCGMQMFDKFYSLIEYLYECKEIEKDLFIYYRGALLKRGN